MILMGKEEVEAGGKDNFEQVRHLPTSLLAIQVKALYGV